VVDQALVNIRQHRLPLYEAVVASTTSRVRPMMMTTTTTLLGLLPLVVAPGAGSELYRGLGAVMLGGLVVSTVFVLVLVPMLFTLAYEIRQHTLRWLGRGEDDTALLAGAVEVPLSVARQARALPERSSPQETPPESWRELAPTESAPLGPDPPGPAPAEPTPTGPELVPVHHDGRPAAPPAAPVRKPR